MTDTGQGNDIEIGGLGFKLAVSKDRPYERATAQYRKDQVDQSPTVGDQSLTGWWTRGQLSFHHGAGVKYYEVLEGETVLNRYADSDSIDPFTPGEVTLLPRLADVSVAAADAVPAPLSAGAGVYALTTSGLKYTAGSGSTTIPTSTGGAPTSLTSSGALPYVVNGNKIERPGTAADTRVNHVTNPSFETGITGWTVPGYGGVPGPFLDSGWSRYGSKSLALTGDKAQTAVSGLAIGQTYRVKAWVNVSSGFSGYYGVGLCVDGTPLVSTTTAGVQHFDVTFTATATSHVLKINSGPEHGGGTGTASGTWFLLDAVIWTEDPYTGDYFDGSRPGCSWNGTPNNSKSTFSTTSTAAMTALITLTGDTWDKVFWAKGRIWAVDSSGRWYALPDVIASKATTDAFWSSGKTAAQGTRWLLTEGTGPVYLSDGHDIYTVTVDSTGAVPTLVTPTTATRMPLGETVYALQYYLGFIIACTSSGVRVVATQDDRLLLGPLVVRGDFAGSFRVGCFDTKAYVAGRPDGHDGDTVLCTLDLAQEVKDLVPAWTTDYTLTTATSRASGVAVDATGRLYAYANNTLWAASVDELAATGTLTTGQHRFGTLEPKQFDSVLVRTNGTGGSIAVSRIDPDGTETSLGTLTASGTLPLGLSVPVESVALKFTLTPDSVDVTHGPTLLGYQLRAMPAPKRQRMIRMPLMLLDRERANSGATTTGHAGSAWERLAALEAMEAAGGSVSYTDYRTGETGQVFVESVEHRGITNPSTMGDGFGGILMVTLRKV